MSGNGASLLDGYMEDLATDRVYRLMIAQRLRYPGAYTPASISEMFDQGLERIVQDLPPSATPADGERYRLARDISENMILLGAFDPK